MAEDLVDAILFLRTNWDWYFKQIFLEHIFLLTSCLHILLLDFDESSLLIRFLLIAKVFISCVLYSTCDNQSRLHVWLNST